MENVKKFYEALQSDVQLKEKAEALNKGFEGKEPDELDKDKVVADLIAFAAGEGYVFTAEELVAYSEEMQKQMEKQAPQKLSEEELEAVAGGTRERPDVVGTCLCAVGGYGHGTLPDGRSAHMACIQIGDMRLGRLHCGCVLVGNGWT